MDAETLALALHGRKCGRTWMAQCPAHPDREPSLAIDDGDDGRVLVHCHAGCDQDRVIAALRSRGLWPDRDGLPAARSRPRLAPRRPSADTDGRVTAQALWRAAIPAAGTLAETYLRSRGIRLPPPQSLRFHGALRHRTGVQLPAMIAQVVHGTDGMPLGIHRTFLANDGAGKGPVKPQKMMLGPCSGGAVQLADPGEVLMIGEGIETCLAAMQATSHPAWAALSTSGLRSLELPPDVRNVIVLADGDAPGEDAARDCAWRWKRQGRRVRIARPPQGMDFNDLLLGRVPGNEERV